MKPEFQNDDPRELSTRAPQYQRALEVAPEKGLTAQGPMIGQVQETDPHHLLLTLSRYQFVAKTLSGRKHVLGIGCADTFGARLVQQEVERLTVTDSGQTFVDDVLRRRDPNWAFECRRHDLLSSPFPGSFDAAYAMDAIGRIPAAQEDILVGNLVRSLTPEGIAILGCPSLDAEVYALRPGRSGHGNGKSGKALRALMELFFHNVFLFSAYDGAIHAGVAPMANYLIAVGSARRETPSKSVFTQEPGAGQSPLDLSVVVPCFNEQHHIGPTLDNLVAAMMELPYRYEVLVVDDGSTDDTAQIVENYLQAHPELPIRFIKNAVNRGLAASYVDAAFLGRGIYFRLVCGDNAEPKETLVEVFRHMGEADMIIPYHDPVIGKSAFRVGLSRLYTSMVNTLSGYKIHYYNGLAVHRRHNVMRWGPYSFGFGFQAELITRLLDEGATSIEIPVRAIHRDKEKTSSAINWKNFLSVGHTLSEVFLRRVRRRVLRK